MLGWRLRAVYCEAVVLNGTLYVFSFFKICHSLIICFYKREITRETE